MPNLARLCFSGTTRPFYRGDAPTTPAPRAAVPRRIARRPSSRRSNWSALWYGSSHRARPSDCIPYLTDSLARRGTKQVRGERTA